MATLVLTTVGSALAGPLGGALGGLVGQSIDRGVFGGGMRRGPRLGDLTMQTSSYGSAIPRIYGLMRVAGTVVWATDLMEEETIEGGGKGSPERMGYAYSVSMAVALSSRPIRSSGAEPLHPPRTSVVAAQPMNTRNVELMALLPRSQGAAVERKNVRPTLHCA